MINKFFKIFFRAVNSRPVNSPLGVVVAPSRELATQIGTEINTNQPMGLIGLPTPWSPPGGENLAGWKVRQWNGYCDSASHIWQRSGGSTWGSPTDSISISSLFSPIYFLTEWGGIREGRGNLFEGVEAQEYIGSRGLGIYWEYRLRNILGVED